jgi:gas vesicle protein
MSRNRKIRTVWFIALGALAGILLAPKSGRETRHAIATEVDDGGKYLTSLGRDTREEMGHVVESGKRRAHKVTHL